MPELCLEITRDVRNEHILSFQRASDIRMSVISLNVTL